MEKGLLYLVYKKNIIGYGEIKEHKQENKDASVGLKPEDVGPGDRLILRGPLTRLNPPIPCVGFKNFRYTEEPLHDIDIKEAQKILRRLGLKSNGANRTQPKAAVVARNKKRG